MTPNEITTLIATDFDKELDIPFKLQLMERVKYWRSRLLDNALTKRPADRKFYRQTLYIPMQKTVDERCAPIVATAVSKNIVPIPRPIPINGILFDYVGGVDGKSPFKEVQPGTANYVATSKFASMFTSFEYNDSYISTDNPNLPLLRLDGIFDDVMAVLEYNCSCGGGPCDTWDIEYPVTGDMLQLIVQSILRIDYQREDKESTPQIEVK